MMSAHKQPSNLASFATIARLDPHLSSAEHITLHGQGVPDPLPESDPLMVTW